MKLSVYGTPTDTACLHPVPQGCTWQEHCHGRVAVCPVQQSCAHADLAKAVGESSGGTAFAPVRPVRIRASAFVFPALSWYRELIQRIPWLLVTLSPLCCISKGRERGANLLNPYLCVRVLPAFTSALPVCIAPAVKNMGSVN